MGKYEPLGVFLRSAQVSEVRMSFPEIERVIGAALPPTAGRERAWWSNNPSNNVMTKVWLDAGFRTEQVDLDGRRLVFRRAAGAPVRPVRTGRHPAFGAMKGTFHISPDLDLTEPADPDWGKVYE